MNPPEIEPCRIVERRITTVDDLIGQLEYRGLGWDIGHTGNLREARVWKWPSVIARYRPTETEPVVKMLAEAMKDIEWSKYPVLEEHVK